MLIIFGHFATNFTLHFFKLQKSKENSIFVNMSSDIGVESSDSENELILLDRVFLRIGSAETDEQLESCLNRFLVPVILKLSCNEQVRTKVMELLVHINKRVKCRSEVKLPVEKLLEQYTHPKDTTQFVPNFAILYITLGFPRIDRESQLLLTPSLLEAIATRPKTHQDGILIHLIPLLGDIRTENLNLKNNKPLSRMLLDYTKSVLLLPYGALPSNIQEGTEFTTPPGLTTRLYRRLTAKNIITADQLEKMKQSIVEFFSKDVLDYQDILGHLIIAAADSRFSVANVANSPLIRASNSVDWSSGSVLNPLYNLYLGCWGPMKDRIPAEDRPTPACTRLRLKLLHYLCKATGPGIKFPQCLQVVFASLYDENSNSRLKQMALNFMINVIQEGDMKQMEDYSKIFLGGIVKIVRSSDYEEHHSKAYMCIGRLAAKFPSSIGSDFSLLEEFITKIPSSNPELKTSIRDALLSMAQGYKVTQWKFLDSKDNDGEKQSPVEEMDTSEPTEVLLEKESKEQPMDVDVDLHSAQAEQEDINSIKVIGGRRAKLIINEAESRTLFALLYQYLQHEDPVIRYIAIRYVIVTFPKTYVPGKYLMLSGMSEGNDEVKTLTLKHLYGTSRPTEIEDVVNKVAKIDAKDGREIKNHNLQLPQFEALVEYIWEEAEKRKKGSNLKQRFVINNQVLPFHPDTYKEMLRYLRLCLNDEAGVKNCSSSPNACSSLLAHFLSDRLSSAVLEHYLIMITTMLNTVPDTLTLTSLLDIVGCIPEKVCSKYIDHLKTIRNIFVNDTREQMRDIAAAIYAIIKIHTSAKQEIFNEINQLAELSQTTKSLESQCGYISASTYMCERVIQLSKKNSEKFGGTEFNIADWEPYKTVNQCLAKNLVSSNHFLVQSACTNIAVLAKCSALPFPNCTPEEERIIQSDKPFKIEQSASADSETKEWEVTKFGLVVKLFGIVRNAKMKSKIKENALYTLGVLCVGEKFPYAKQIIMGFLEMAKDTKEFEIHLEIGESLVLCIEGVNSPANHNLWSSSPPEGASVVRDGAAQTHNDALLAWLLQELLNIAKDPHPNSKQACSVWLLALVKNCSDREPIKTKLQVLQQAFMDLLSENNDIVQDVASKGLSLVYQSCSAQEKSAMMEQLMDQLSSGRKQVAQVTQDTQLFEEGQLGKAPTGGNLSTYKELCSLASDLNQPDLIYKFMHLANHNAIWNSKKGAAFGFQSIALQAGEALAALLPAVVPRLYRYRHDPTPSIQHSMTAIWTALVPETHKTVQLYHKEILEDLVTNLTANQWRVRMSCCNGLTELLRGAHSLHDSLPQLGTIWEQIFRVMDDVHEGTRLAATNTATTLSKLCIRASDVNLGKSGKEIVAVTLPILLDKGITNLVKEVRAVSLGTISKLVESAGESLRPFLITLLPALAIAAGELESTSLSKLSTMLGSHAGTQEVVDNVRAQAAKGHYTSETIVKCVPYLDKATFNELLPRMLELMKCPQLGTKIVCCHFLVLASHHLRDELEESSARIVTVLTQGALDRNAAVRKSCGEALGHICCYAKESSIEKMFNKLCAWYHDKEEESVKAAVAAAFKSIANHNSELIRNYADTIAPMIYFAVHTDKTPETEKMIEHFEDVWGEISPGKETGIRLHLKAIVEYLEDALQSRQWTRKAQAAKTAGSLATDLNAGLGEYRERLIHSLLAAIKGKTFDGKSHMLHALAKLCTVKSGEEPLSEEVVKQSLAAMLVECGKREPLYKEEALGALGEMLAQLHADCFDDIYQIIKDILSQNEAKDADSDDDDDPATVVTRRRARLSLKNAAYSLLGKAWPDNQETQNKYQLIFFEHYREHFSSQTRATQLVMMSSLSLVVTTLHVLRDTHMPSPTTHAILANITEVLDYCLQISNNTRLRKEAMNICTQLGKQFKSAKWEVEFVGMRSLYEKHSAALAADPAPEIRARLDLMRATFQPTE